LKNFYLIKPTKSQTPTNFSFRTWCGSFTTRRICSALGAGALPHTEFVLHLVRELYHEWNLLRTWCGNKTMKRIPSALGAEVFFILNIFYFICHTKKY
jgi:hypothetical protein